MFKERLFKTLGAVAILAGGLLSVGCGTSPAYEADYPQNYVAPPPPATNAELAAQQEARAQEARDSREVLVGENVDEYSDTDPGALTEFKPALDSHGQWVQDSTYGTVWVPASAEVGTDFQPYVTAGHWTYSESTDYVWVSDYEWGWAPFHYGRWVHLPGHGWSWIPGRRYAGAWVVWREGPAGYGYVGWAPAPPEYYWYGGYAVGWSFGWYHYNDYYAFCPHNRFYYGGYGGVSTYVVRGPAARDHYGRTHDYAPANPSVGNGGAVAGGGSGERQLANPTVGGTQHVVAKPTVGGKGPRPDEMGNKDMIVAPPGNNSGLSKAQAFSTPKTAVAAGGAAPQHMRGAMGASSSPSSASNLVPGSAAASQNPNAGARGPASASMVPPSSHSAVASAPQYRSSSGQIVSTPSPRPTFGGSSSMSSTAPAQPSRPSSTSSFSGSMGRTDPRPSSSFRGGYSSPSAAASPPPSFRSSSPSVSAPSPSMRSGASSFRSSSPSPAPRMSSPPTTTFRSSQSSVRPSSPSVSTPSRSSTPSSGAHRSGSFSKRR